MRGTTQPDQPPIATPTFFNTDKNCGDSTKDVSGIDAIARPVDTIRPAPRQDRLTRKQFENLLDAYYADRCPGKVQTASKADHSGIAGARLVRKMALFGSVAMLAGFALGLQVLSSQGGNTRLGASFNAMLSQVSSMFIGASTAQKTQAPARASFFSGRSRPVAGKPVKTASISVSDVSGVISAGIALKLAVTPKPANDKVVINITNVPGDAVLTAGKRNVKGVWVLKPDDLENVALVLSSPRQQPLHLGVEVVEVKTGQLLTPLREVKVALLAAPTSNGRGF